MDASADLRRRRVELVKLDVGIRDRLDQAVAQHAVGDPSDHDGGLWRDYLAAILADRLLLEE